MKLLFQLTKLNNQSPINGKLLQMNTDDNIEIYSQYIRSFNHTALEDAISKITNLNCENEQGNTLPAVAAWNGNLKALELLHKHGANLEIPRVMIFSSRHSTVMDYLMNNKIFDHTKQDENGYTVLQQACIVSFIDIMEDNNVIKVRLDNIKYILEQGADIDQTNIYGRTALHEAIYSGHVSIVDLLIKSNANLSVKCNDGFLPRQYTQDNNIHKLLKRGTFKIVKK